MEDDFKKFKKQVDNLELQSAAEAKSRISVRANCIL